MNLARLIPGLLAICVTLFAFVSPAAAAGPTAIIVSPGDTLYSIAARNNTSVEVIMRANGLPNADFIWVGQRLIIPGDTYTSSGSTATTATRATAVPTVNGGTTERVPGAPTPGAQTTVTATRTTATPNAAATVTATVYTVGFGESLASIALRFGTTVDALARVNGLYNPNYITAGQRLTIPGRAAIPASGSVPATLPSKTAPAPTTGKWIDVNLTTQTLTALEGTKVLKAVLISSGLAASPTPVGSFAVYSKVISQTMSGGQGASYYNLPGVPWVMYFSGGNAIHGAYWHRNFGTPMSHGCVNASVDDAKWLFEWGEVGTPVVVHA